MIKRIISLLFAMLLLIGHAGAQDESIHLNFILKAGNEETPVSFDASFGRDEIRIVSELFPSYCLSLRGIPAADAFQCLRVENTEGFSVNPEYQKVVSDWISGLQSTVKKGIYAGDLFDEAYSVSEGICTSMAMFRLLQLLHICPLLSIFPDHCLSAFCPAESDPATIHFHVYESGKYLSFSGVVSEHTVFTLSADLSDSSLPRVLVGYPEKGTNYYWLISSDYSDSKTAQIRSCLYSDHDQKGFRTVSAHDPVMTNVNTLSFSTDFHELSFDSRLLPGNTSGEVQIKGKWTPGENRVLEGTITFRENEDNRIQFSAVFLPDEVTSNGLKNVSPDGSEIDLLGFRGEAYLHLSDLYPALLRILPAEYIRILFQTGN